MSGNLMECNVWMAGGNDSDFGLLYCDIMGNIYPPLMSSFNLFPARPQTAGNLVFPHLQSWPCSSWFMISLSPLDIEFTAPHFYLLLNSSPSSLNHLQSSCPKNRACFRFRPQLSRRRKTLKLSTHEPTGFLKLSPGTLELHHLML